MSKIIGKIIVSDPKVFEKFSNVIYRPIKESDIYSPLELFVKNLKAKIKRKKKGGRKSKYNVKMTRKFRRTRRKRGAGGTGPKKAKPRGTDTSGRCDVDWDCAEGYECIVVDSINNRRECRKQKGGRRRTKKRKSRRRKKRTRRRRRKKR